MPLPTSFLKGYDAPLPPYGASLCLSVPALTPVVLGSLELRAQNVCYTIDTAYGAVQAIREIQLSVITGITTLDSLYRLLDTALTGTIYSEVSPGDIEPPIPAIPYVMPSTLSVLQQLYWMPSMAKAAQNFVNGTVFPGEFEDDRNVRQQLDDILTAINTGELSIDEVESLLTAIVTALG